MTTLREAMLTTFGLGHLRPASGTWGSLPPPALAALIVAPAVLGGDGWSAGLWIGYHAALLAVLLVFSLACATWGDWAEARFGRKDPGQVVADETAGQCIPLMLLPAEAIATPVSAIATLAGAFVLFRLLDIIKPWPARGLQRLPGGWGILIDDLVAGLQAAIILQVMTRALL